MPGTLSFFGNIANRLSSYERRNLIKWQMAKWVAVDIEICLNLLTKIRNLKIRFPCEIEFYQELKKINEEKLRGAFLGYYYGRDGYMMTHDPARTFDKELCMEKLSSISLEAIQESLEELEEQHSAMVEIRDSFNIDNYHD